MYFIPNVALFTRAWIEIRIKTTEPSFIIVALFTRAWIEIILPMFFVFIIIVALFTRAWIEIESFHSNSSCRTGRPLHEGVD